MTTQTVVRAGLFALTIVALSFVPGFSLADSPSAKGKGDFISNGNVRLFSFHAIQHHNGVVTGKAEVNIPATGSFVQMAIDCLSFAPPNTAYVGGTITKSNVSGVPVGQTRIFEAQDNGKGTKDSGEGTNDNGEGTNDNREGSDGPPDRLSLLIPFSAGTDCRTFPELRVDLGLIDLQHGHIKVRP